MNDRTRGLYEKFYVERTDGRSAPGQKHEGCEYYVLDLDHDKHAAAALEAYATSCEAEYPALAADLRAKALTIREEHGIASRSAGGDSEPRFTLQIDHRLINCDASHKAATNALQLARIHGPDVRTIDALEETLARVKAAERDFIQVHKNCIEARARAEKAEAALSASTDRRNDHGDKNGS